MTRHSFETAWPIVAAANPTNFSWEAVLARRMLGQMAADQESCERPELHEYVRYCWGYLDAVSPKINI